MGVEFMLFASIRAIRGPSFSPSALQLAIIPSVWGYPVGASVRWGSVKAGENLFFRSYNGRAMVSPNMLRMLRKSPALGSTLPVSMRDI